MNDYPFEEARTWPASAARGDECYQKFTCAGCGQRLTMDVPNVLYTSGSCDRGGVTDIKAQGCNFLLLRTIR